MVKQVLLFFCTVLIMFEMNSVYAQSTEISGKVIDSSGLPLSGAVIKIVGSSKAAISDAEGKFRLTANSSNVLLRVSMVGFTDQETKASAGKEIQIKMLTTDKNLSEVVVTALGIKKDKRNLTFSSQVVSGESIEQAKEPSILNSMTGKVAGVQITSSTGMPGSSSRIVIRGITSLYGDNQALIVVDGVPVNNDETDNPTDGGSGSNRLNDIDPSIIENVNILKGAAATALYGSAGARGVVLITTKKGLREAKPRVSFSSFNSLETAILPEHQTEYSLGDQGHYYDGDQNQIGTSWGARMDTLMTNNKNVHFYDPLKQFFKDGFTTQDNASVSGGNATSDYLFSYSLAKQTGTEPSTSYLRQNFFTKYNVNILPKLTATFQLTYSNSKNYMLPQSYASNPLFTVYNAPVSYDMEPYENADGSQRLYRSGRDNPYWIVNNTQDKSVVNRFLPVITVNWQPTSWLSVMERGGADIYVDRYHSYVDIGSETYQNGLIVTDNTTFKQYNNDFIISLKKQFGEKWNTSILFGNNILSTYSENQYAYGTDLSTPGFFNMKNAANVQYTESSNLKRKVGFYSQAEVDYDKFLVLSLTGRYDGSSVLSTENQWYPYGSAAAGFIFSELLSDKAKKVIDFGKIRISYASVGNDNVDAYANNTYYEQASITGANGIPLYFPYNGQNGFLMSSAIGNANLKNELQKEFETGLEMRFLNDRLGFEASYYHRNMSNGIISDFQLPYSSGYSSTTINSAKLSTNGFELLINGSPVKTKNFGWDVSLNFTKIKTMVNYIGAGLDQATIGTVTAIKGQEYGQIMGTKYSRENGQLLIDDNGLPVSDYNPYVLGNVSPDWLGGITNTFRYKTISLSFLIDVKKGGDIVNSQNGYGLYYGTAKKTENRADRVIDGINENTKEKNTVSVSGETYWENASGITENLIEDDSYAKLRNLTLTYSVPNSLLKKLPFENASISFTGKNLIILKSKSFDAGDPEAVSSGGSSNGALGNYLPSVPTSRSYGVTLNLNFK